MPSAEHHRRPPDGLIVKFSLRDEFRFSGAHHERNAAVSLLFCLVIEFKLFKKKLVN